MYSLGVVLYELLAGGRPHRRQARFARSAGGRHRPDRSDPAQRCRRPTPSRRRLLRGDLDTIILKALKKNPDERYATVNAFGDDLQRYLDGRPVLARPDSTSYRVSKFVRRNPIAVGAAAAVVVSLAVFGGVSAWQARVLAEQRRVAQIERDTSEQVVSVLIDLFQTTDPSVRPDGDRMPIGEFLSDAQTRSLEQLRGVARRAGEAAAGLRSHPPFTGPVRRGARGARGGARRTAPAGGPDHPAALESLQALGELARFAGEDDRARALLDESLERHQRVYGDRHERTARVLFAMAPVVGDRDIDEAGRLLLRALDIRRATLGPNHPDVGESLAALGGYYTRRKDYDRARDYYRQALAVFPRPQDRRNPIAITILNDFANLHGTLNERDEAEALQREAIEMGRRCLGPRP